MQAPEFTISQDARDRLAGAPPCDQLAEPPAGGSRHLGFRESEYARRVPPERLGNQKPRLSTRIRDPGGAQARGGIGERGPHCSLRGDAHCTSASFAAWSSASRASMISSSASPFTTLSIL